MKITLAKFKFKKEVGKTPQNRIILNDHIQKLNAIFGERRNETIQSLNDIAQGFLEKFEKNSSDDNGGESGGGGLPSGLNIKIIIVLANTAINYLSQEKKEENKEIFSRLTELVTQYTANPSDAALKEIQKLVAKATVIKQSETGKGLADLVGKSGIGIVTEIAKTAPKKGSLSDAVESLKKILPKDSKIKVK